MKPRILIVDDEESWREILSDLLERQGYIVSVAEDEDQAQIALQQTLFHLAIIDLRLESGDRAPVSGLQLLRQIADSGQRLPYCIVLTGYPTAERARDSFKYYGVVDFVLKSRFDDDAFLKTVAEAIDQALGLDSTILLNTTWQAFISHLDEQMSETTARLTSGLIRAIAETLNLPIVDDTIRQEDHLFMCQLDAASVFEEIRIPSSMPLLCLSKREIYSEDLDTLRHVLDYAFEQPKPVALLIIGQEECSQRTSELLEKATRAYSLDIILLCYHDILRLLSARDPQLALRSLILSQIDLAPVSPFVTMAPVPDVMFFGRERELRLIVGHARDVSYTVIGGRRIGKTSLLLRLHCVRLPAAGFRTIYHDCSNTTTYDSFCAASIHSWYPQPPFNAPTTFGALLQSVPIDKPLVLLLDEADSLVSSDHAENWRLFNTLRALANAGHVRVILSGERTLRDALREPSSPLFNFADELRLGPLDFHATAELITQPMKQLEIVLDEEEMLVRQIYDFTSGHPNVVQRLCRRLIERLNTMGVRRVTLDDVHIVIEDPGFQRDDFLDTYWGTATRLEKIISLLMVNDEQVRTLDTVQQSLRQRCKLRPKVREVDSALQLLVDIRSILKRTARGYEFAVTSFPRAIAGTVTSNDMLEILAEEFRDQHA